MTQDLRNLLKEARTIIRCHARHFAKDWDERATKALADTPPQRQWVGLTDEELMELHDPFMGKIEFSRAIEAKLKEKNGFTEEKNT